MRTLAISNFTEFNQGNIRGRHLPSVWDMWRRAGDELADSGAFWGGDDKVLLAPAGTDHGWLDDVREAMGWTIDLVEPSTVTGRLLEDALLDAGALQRLAGLLAGPARIEAWGATPGLLRLHAALRAMGVEAEVEAPAVADLWTVEYLDTKLALNDLAQWVPGLRVPRSHTAVTFEHAVGLARTLVASNVPFVVKSNVGVGGFGSFAVTAPAETGPAEAIRRLAAAMEEEPVFREGPFVVQEWIPEATGPLRPTFDAVVRADGTVDVVGTGGMLVEGCTYRGVAVGDVPLPPAVSAAAVAAGSAIGEAAAALGFRGWYDVDFVVSPAGELFATEINARRTSPAHAFGALERWQRLDPRIRCVVADDHILVSNGMPASWRSLRTVIDAMRQRDVCCVASIVRTLRGGTPTIGAMIGAVDYATAIAARGELLERLERPARSRRRLVGPARHGRQVVRAANHVDQPADLLAHVHDDV